MGIASAAPTRENWMSSASTRMDPWPENLGGENCARIEPRPIQFYKSYERWMVDEWEMERRRLDD